MNIMEVGEVEKVVKVSDKSRGQDRFFIDVSDNAKGLELIQGLLKEVNTKKYGRKLILKDLVFVALMKLKQKDLEALKESSVQRAELLKRHCDTYNEANKTDYGPYDYAYMMLKKNGTLS